MIIINKQKLSDLLTVASIIACPILLRKSTPALSPVTSTQTFNPASSKPAASSLKHNADYEIPSYFYMNGWFSTGTNLTVHGSNLLKKKYATYVFGLISTDNYILPLYYITFVGVRQW